MAKGNKSVANGGMYDSLILANGGARLDIGCGAAKQDGWLGMDIRPLPGVDIVWDINKHPWPIPDGSIRDALSSHLIEHIPPVAIDPTTGTWFPFVEFMNEVWRILKNGGTFAIACPHGYSPGFLQDPTHCNQVSEVTFAYFDPLEPNTGGMLYRIYKPKPWKIHMINWSPAGNIEAVLIKRIEDKSYYE